jgi:peptidoglycan/LPS O-acetylase OafA/YrhL
VTIAGTNRTAKRRSDVDLIRAFLVLGLIFFHTANIFGPVPYEVNNNEVSIVLVVLVGFFSQWGMPLLFFLAGFTAGYSLNTRTPGQYVTERLKRLFIPFIFGIFVVVPPMRYYSLLAGPDYHESYWRFYTKFFQVEFRFSFPRFIRPDPEVGLFETGHLWFLYYLFVFSLLALPLFMWLRRERGRILVSRLADFSKRRGRILILAIPVVLIQIFVSLGETVGWNRYSFLAFLIYGYIFASEPRLEVAARENAMLALVTGSLAILAFMWVAAVAWQEGIDPSVGYSWQSVLWRLFKGLSSWFWVVAIWGMAQRYRERRVFQERALAFEAGKGGIAAKLLKYANEAVLPFYIVHQTAIVIIGFYVVKWDAGITLKYLTISLASAAATVLVYEVFVKPTNVTRLLFGMRLKRP